MRAPLLALLVGIGTLGLSAPASAASPACASFAATLPQIVRKDAVAAVDDSYDIHLWSFCRGFQFLDTGNAGGLSRTIANNPVLARAIADADPQARPDDVKYVRIVGKRIDLWLHHDPR